MTRVNVLAQILYRTAVELKHMDFNKLVWKHNREKLISSLSAMQFLTACIGLKNISVSQAEEIISILRVTYNYNAEDFSNALIGATAESDYSAKYEELLFLMHSILSECINSIVKKGKGCVNTISRHIMAFHNLPRAFLSISDRDGISMEDAIEYSKSYLKHD